MLPLGSPVAASAETDDVMSIHKFAVGQTVDFVPGPGDANVPRGKYRIQRLQPSETRDPQYRVKHAVDGHERVVAESQIAARDSRLG
jgi:hypothetical protein